MSLFLRVFLGFLAASGVILCLNAEDVASTPQTCIWLGTANDGKWETADNWDIPPVSGRGDTVIVKNTSTDTSTYKPISLTLDTESFSVAAMQFGDATNHPGTAAVTLSGSGSLSVSATYGWQCFETTTCEIPVTFTHVTESRINAGRSAIFKKTVTANGSFLGCDQSKCHTSTDPTYLKKGCVYFYAPVYAPNAVVRTIWGSMTVYFYDTLECTEVWAGYSNTNGYMEFHKAGSSIPKLEVHYWGHIIACTENALPTNAVLMWRHNYPSGCSAQHYYQLNTNQIVDRAESDVPWWKPSGKPWSIPTNSTCFEVKSEANATLTMRATKSATSWIACDLAMSLVYDPIDNYTQKFCDRYNTMTGTLRVKGGTLASCGSNTFYNVSRLNVDAGATFAVSTSSVYNVTLNPFADKTDLYISSTGHLDIPKDVTLTFKNASVAGMRIAVGRYQGNAGEDESATRVTWINGKGLVAVTACLGTSWKAGVSGNWGDPNNWCNGLPSDTKPPLFEDDEYTPYTVSFNETDSWPKTLTIKGAGKTLQIAQDKNLLVDCSESGHSFILEDGATLLVEGTLVLTNWNGTFALRSSTENPSTVKITGAFDYAPMGDKPLALEKGGVINAAGGVFTGNALDTSKQSIATAGGAVLASGTGKIRFWGGSYGNSQALQDATMTFSDDAALSWRSLSGGTPNVMLNPENRRSICLTFLGRSRIASSSDGFAISPWSSSTSRIVFASSAMQTTGYRVRVTASGDDTVAELIVSNGYMKVGDRGLDIACSGYTSRRTGTFRLLGGVLYCAGSNNGWNDQYKPNGFTVAYGLSSTMANEVNVLGKAEFGDGVFTNHTDAVLLVGVGSNARGDVMQTGGTFLQNSTNEPFGLGFSGGQGYWTVSNGTLNVAGKVWLGGATTNIFKVNPKKPITNWQFDKHDALGEFRFVGGTVNFNKDIILGAEGVGRLVRVGSLGALTVAGDLVFSNHVDNAASGGEIVFDFDDQSGIKPLDFGGKVILDKNARATINLSNYSGKRIMIPLLTAKQGIVCQGTLSAASLADLDVTLEGNAKLVRHAVPYLANGVLGVEITHGTVLIVR